MAGGTYLNIEDGKWNLFKQRGKGIWNPDFKPNTLR